MASGLPVIVPADAGAAELITHLSDGYLMSRWNSVDELATGLTYLEDAASEIPWQRQQEKNCRKKHLARRSALRQLRSFSILLFEKTTVEDMIHLSIIVVNYNTSNLLDACLDSIQKQNFQFTYEVIVWDNSSHDDSVTMVRARYPDVKLMASTANVGFASAITVPLQRLKGISCCS